MTPPGRPQQTALSCNILEQVANHPGVNSKTSVEPRQWFAASPDGSRQAVRYIVDHCVQDVLVLEKVIGALRLADVDDFIRRNYLLLTGDGIKKLEL